MRFRIEHAVLVLLCLIVRIFRRGRAGACDSPGRVIVFPSGKLGDIVCTTPVLRTLQDADNEVFVAADSPMVKRLLADAGLVDGYVDVSSIWSAFRNIRRGSFDACVVTGPTFRSTALAYIAGVPCVIAPRVTGGHSPQYETRSYRIVEKFITTFPYAMGEYAPRERLRSLEPLGIYTSDTTKHLGYSADAKKRVKDFLSVEGVTKGDFLVGISPSAGNKIKEWPPERFAEVADYIQQNGKGRVFIVGGPSDQELADNMRKAMKTEAVDTTGVWNLDELKAIISKLNLFVSVDTGPIYIAEAFNVPTIDIVGPMDEQEQPPRGSMHKWVLPKRKEPELHILNSRVYNKREALRQIMSITVSDVISAIKLEK